MAGQQNQGGEAELPPLSDQDLGIYVENIMEEFEDEIGDHALKDPGPPPPPPESVVGHPSISGSASLRGPPRLDPNVPGSSGTQSTTTSRMPTRTPSPRQGRVEGQSSVAVRPAHLRTNGAKHSRRLGWSNCGQWITVRGRTNHA